MLLLFKSTDIRGGSLFGKDAHLYGVLEGPESEM